MDEEDGSIVYPLESDGPPEGGQWLRHAFPLSIPGLELAYFENTRPVALSSAYGLGTSSASC